MNRVSPTSATVPLPSPTRHAGGGMAGRVEGLRGEVADSEFLAVGEQPVELSAVTGKGIAQVEEFSENLLHLRDMAANAKYATHLLFQVRGGRHVIRVNNSRVHSTCASSSRTRAISLSALVVWVRPDFGSKSRTLSTSAQRLVRVSSTRYPTARVTGSKKPSICMGQSPDMGPHLVVWGGVQRPPDACN